ncbi:B3/B4 domain-containing protein [Nocardiopsis ansamitocini]|uniref:B3/B4 tRNA-binding domain-containing protein n=1 Tax=Nocardiopsis ansamitocini TaxID=1670832 RepID=A0A9W6P933_9ACTN|nr:phenylalanine--tRNA ligase beta subunit-related protein [Nocardiopsis ansamitocini]GLU49376.1 hypothetical protein Nans01_37270 [Nocardiopsis ansamitocini]
MTADLSAWLDEARVDDAVFTLRPDYRAFLIAAEGLRPGPSDAASEALLADAESRATTLLADTDPADLPHVHSWREAFRSFGAKPQRTRTSVEALLRRASEGLPRVDRLTDAYNAVSVSHVVPVGGEDLDCYQGPLHLVRASGDEEFETSKAGESIIEHPAPGEVVWRDATGVTCRRWNWRQCLRTRLTETTTRGIFIIDTLAPMTSGDVEAAGDALLSALHTTSPELKAVSRLLTR